MRHVILSLLLSKSAGRMNEDAYGLRQRSVQKRDLNTAGTIYLKYSDIKTIGLTFSDDPEPIRVPEFFLALYETDGNLPMYPSMATVQDGISQYLKLELNQHYDRNNQVASVRTTILSQSNVASTRRILQSMGSQLETEVEVTFKHSPMPSSDDVDKTVTSVLEQADLSNLLRNITSLAVNDTELESLNGVFFLGRKSEEVPKGDDASPVKDQEQPKEKEKKSMEVSTIIPVVLVVFVAILLISLFAFKHRRNGRSSAGSDISNAQQDIGIFWCTSNISYADQADIFSVEAALLDSSPKHASTLKNQKRAVSGGTIDDQSDVFHGISNAESTFSPKETRSIFSFLSGYKSEASTVVASNLTKRSPQVAPALPSSILGSQQMSPATGGHVFSEGGTPRSKISSLFTFSEENSADLDSEDSEYRKPKTSFISEINVVPSDEDLTPANTPRNLAEQQEPMPMDSTTVVMLAKVEKSTEPRDNDGEKETTGKVEEAQDVPLVLPASTSVAQDDQSWTCNVPCEDHCHTKSNMTAEEIKNELQAAEEETERLKIMAIPADTFSKLTSVPSDSPKVIQLQWDNASKAQENRDKAAKFVKTVASRGKSESSGETSAQYQCENASSSPSSLFDNIEGTMNPATETIETLTIARKQSEEFIDSPPGISHGRKASMTPSAADGSARYQVEASSTGSLSLDSESKESLSKQKDQGSTADDNIAGIDLDDQFLDSETDISPNGSRRRHTKSTAEDGTKNYQNETMGEWSLEGDQDDPSLEDSDSVTGRLRRRKFFGLGGLLTRSPRSPRNFNDEGSQDRGTPASNVSGMSLQSPMSESSANKKLIDDLVWIEQKIARPSAQNHMEEEGVDIDPSPRAQQVIDQVDSMSFASADDGAVSGEDNCSILDQSGASGNSIRDGGAVSVTESPVNSIVCRDCYAPPGKLRIVIHSTKDGPAVHTVKKGSTLEGHIFPGDLIISVDNVDTRSYTAEQVMKLMTAKTRFERKITVLHFENGEN